MPDVRPLFTASVTSEIEDHSKILFMNSNINENINESNNENSLSNSNKFMQ